MESLVDNIEYSPMFKDFIKDCLKKDPRQCPSFSDLMSNEFLKKADTSIINEFTKNLLSLEDNVDEKVSEAGYNYLIHKPVLEAKV